MPEIDIIDEALLEKKKEDRKKLAKAIAIKVAVGVGVAVLTTLTSHYLGKALDSLDEDITTEV